MRKKENPKSIAQEKASDKIDVWIDLDSDVIEALRASGAGWQTRANEFLRQALKLSEKRVEV